MVNVNFPAAILHWLTAGYPEGVPPQDRIPLLALLRRNLTEEQVEEVIYQLVDPNSGAPHAGSFDKAEIEALISSVKGEKPTEKDIARVASKLAAGGWPLAAVDFSQA